MSKSEAKKVAKEVVDAVTAASKADTDLENAIMKAKELALTETTKSAIIRGLAADGVSISNIAKSMGIPYAHAYTVANTPLKGRPAKKIVVAIEAVTPKKKKVTVEKKVTSEEKGTGDVAPAVAAEATAAAM